MIAFGVDPKRQEPARRVCLLLVCRLGRYVNVAAALGVSRLEAEGVNRAGYVFEAVGAGGGLAGGSTRRWGRARLRARSTKGGLWRSHAEITCSPRRSRLSALLAGGWSRRLFATTRTRGTESAGATGTKAFTRRRMARSGATSPRAARGSTAEPRPPGWAPGHGLRIAPDPELVPEPRSVARLDLAWTRSRLDRHGCHAGALRPDALCGG
jgi:hypothetical protein